MFRRATLVQAMQLMEQGQFLVVAQECERWPKKREAVSLEVLHEAIKQPTLVVENLGTIGL